MRYAILADIHGNREAFSAVLDDIGKKDDIEAGTRIDRSRTC